MKLLSYNICGSRLLREPDLAVDSARLIVDADADVVALQEVVAVNGHCQAAELARLTDMEYLFQPVHKSRRGVLGNAILSKTPATEHRTHELPFRFPQPRGALEAHLAVDGHDITVFCTHLVHMGGLMGPVRRRQLDYLAEQLHRTEKPWLLAGDLNTMSGHPELQPLKKIGLHLAPVADPSPTYPAHQPRWRLDYIGAAPGCEWLLREALPAQHSDHLPLFGELRWRGDE